MRIFYASEPSVSVVIPTYNMRIFVGEAINSVLRQTYQDFEIVVVDDGSTDGTRELVSHFQSDKRVRYVYQDNRGLAGARNRGIRESHGQTIAFLDADDLWLPAKLEKQMQTLGTNPDVDVVYCAFRPIDTAGNVLFLNYDLRIIRPSLYEELMYRNVIAGSGSSVLVRAKCFAEVGLFDENLLACEDLDMWRRLALAHKFSFLDDVLVYIRLHRSNMQQNTERMALGWERYISKMKADTPREFKYHLPEIAHRKYWEFALAYCKQRNFIKSMSFTYKIVLLGPKHLVVLVRDLWHAVFVQVLHAACLFKNWLWRDQNES